MYYWARSFSSLLSVQVAMDHIGWLKAGSKSISSLKWQAILTSLALIHLSIIVSPRFIRFNLSHIQQEDICIKDEFIYCSAPIILHLSNIQTEINYTGFNPELRELCAFSSFSICRLGFPLRFPLFSVPVGGLATFICHEYPRHSLLMTEKMCVCVVLFHGFVFHD